MNSVPKLIAGAKQLAGGLARESHVHGTPGDAFRMLLDKAEKAGAAVATRHASVAGGFQPALSDAIQGMAQNGPLLLPNGPPRDGPTRGGAAEDGDTVDGAEKPESDRPDEGPGQGLVVPVTIDVTLAAVGSPPLPVAIDIDPSPPVPDDSQAERAQVERRDPGSPLFTKTDAQAVPRADTQLAAPKQPPTIPKMQPASPETVPVSAPQPNEARVRNAQGSVATVSIAEPEQTPVPPVPRATVVRYRALAAPDRPRPSRSDQSDSAAPALATDAVPESGPSDETPRRVLARAAPDHAAISGEKLPEAHAEPIAQGGPPQASVDDRASIGLPAATVETLGTIVTDAARTLSSVEPAANADSLAPTAETTGPARHVEMAIDLQDYGVVNLRLTVVGEALTLRMSAGHADTARRLEHEREALGSILSRAGYDADIRPVDRTPPPAATAASPDGFAQAGGSAPFTDPGSRRADPGGQPARSGNFPEQADVDETGPASARRAGALYV